MPEVVYSGTPEIMERNVLACPSNEPHLLLMDKWGNVRFTLAFSAEFGEIHVLAIQRAPMRKLFRWSSLKEETQKSREFQQELGGIHPAEFLFSEFLQRNRELVSDSLSRGGVGVFLSFKSNHKKDYMPIVERFFMKLSANESVSLTQGFEAYKLNPNKKRVRDILGLNKKK